MYRVVWALIAEYHNTDQSGKNSYMGIFEQTNFTAALQPGQEKPDFPLPEPVRGPQLTVGFRIHGEAGEPEFRMEVFDPDEQVIGSTLGLGLKLPYNPEGVFTANFTLQGGFPVHKPGIYSFRLFHGDDVEPIGEAQLRIGFTFAQADEAEEQANDV